MKKSFADNIKAAFLNTSVFTVKSNPTLKVRPLNYEEYTNFPAMRALEGKIVHLVENVRRKHCFATVEYDDCLLRIPVEFLITPEKKRPGNVAYYANQEKYIVREAASMS